MLAILMIGFIATGWGQPAGPNNAGTGANVTGIGTIAWTNPGNIVSDNNSFATVTLPNNGSTSNYLRGTNYGFSIPGSATITGITVVIGKLSSNFFGFTAINDNAVYLVKNGTITGANRAAGTWPTSETAVSYGGAADLWGTTWTPADINNTNFGVVLSAVNNTGLGVSYTASVDYMQITVNYSLPTLPVITGFSPTSACTGSSQAIVITGSNFTGATAVTFFNGQPASFTVNSSTQITATLPSGATTGPVSVTTPAGTGTSATNFTVNPLPTAGITNNSGTTVLTCSLTSISVTATGGVSYSWDGGATPATAANSFNAPGTYTVTVTDGNGCTDDASITITQDITVPTATLSGGGGACIGDDVDLTVTFTGTSPWDFTYTANGGAPIAVNDVTSPYTLTVNPTGNTTYALAGVTGGNGCAGTVGGTADVVTGPMAYAPDILICGGTAMVSVPIKVKSFDNSNPSIMSEPYRSP